MPITTNAAGQFGEENAPQPVAAPKVKQMLKRLGNTATLPEGSRTSRTSRKATQGADKLMQKIKSSPATAKKKLGKIKNILANNKKAKSIKPEKSRFTYDPDFSQNLGPGDTRPGAF